MIIKKEVSYAKEIGEMLDLVVAVIDTVKNKKPIAELIDELTVAIMGMEQTGEEIKDIQAVINTVAPKVWEIVELFTKKEEVPEVVTV